MCGVKFLERKDNEREILYAYRLRKQNYFALIQVDGYWVVFVELCLMFECEFIQKKRSYLCHYQAAPNSVHRVRPA